MRVLAIATLFVMICAPARADELNDLQDLACLQASTDLEREHIGCEGGPKQSDQRIVTRSGTTVVPED